MFISRRKLTLAASAGLAAASMLSDRGAWAQSGEQAAVNEAIHALTKAMLAADKGKLEDLVADQLSYGHSSGTMESKAQFVDVIVSKKTVYKIITL